MNNTVSTELCAMLIGYASKIGIDSNDILNSVGIKKPVLSDSYERIALKKYGLLWKQFLHKSNDPDFGLNFGISGYSIKGGGILSSVLKNCPTLRVALEKLIKYHDLSGELSVFELEENGHDISIIINPIHSGIEFHRHTAEALLASLYTIVNELSGGNISFLEIRFAHSMPEDVSTHKTIFNSKLLFDQKENRLIFEKKYLSQPIFLADSVLLENLQQFAQKQIDDLRSTNEWSIRVKRKIGEILLNADKPGVGIISEELNLSTRSLQNKLKNEAASYQSLLDEVRKNLAVSFIKKPDTSINDLAFLLGYSDQSAFSHSFKKWTGISAIEYRKNLNFNR